MLPTIVVLTFLLALAIFAGAWLYLNILDKRIENAEIARIKNLSPDEQQKMLNEKRGALREARRNYDYLNSLWLKYPWGRTRNNPYYIQRFAAAMECSRLNHLIGNLEKAVSAA